MRKFMKYLASALAVIGRSEMLSMGYREQK